MLAASMSVSRWLVRSVHRVPSVARCHSGLWAGRIRCGSFRDSRPAVLSMHLARVSFSATPNNGGGSDKPEPKEMEEEGQKMPSSQDKAKSSGSAPASGHDTKDPRSDQQAEPQKAVPQHEQGQEGVEEVEREQKKEQEAREMDSRNDEILAESTVSQYLKIWSSYSQELDEMRRHLEPICNHQRMAINSAVWTMHPLMVKYKFHVKPFLQFVRDTFPDIYAALKATQNVFNACDYSDYRSIERGLQPKVPSLAESLAEKMAVDRSKDVSANERFQSIEEAVQYLRQICSPQFMKHLMQDMEELRKAGKAYVKNDMSFWKRLGLEREFHRINGYQDCAVDQLGVHLINFTVIKEEQLEATARLRALQSQLKKRQVQDPSDTEMSREEALELERAVEQETKENKQAMTQKVPVNAVYAIIMVTVRLSEHYSQPVGWLSGKRDLSNSLIVRFSGCISHRDSGNWKLMGISKTPRLLRSIV